MHVVAHASGRRIVGKSYEYCYVHNNRVTCAANQDKTPFEVCYGYQPHISDLKVFGARGYARTYQQVEKIQI